MSALFELHTNLAPEFATTPNLTAAPRTFSERYDAEYAATQADDTYWNVQKARAKRYDKIINDIHTLSGGERLRNPETNDATMDEIRENHGQPYPMIFQKRRDKVHAKARELRGALPEGGFGTEPGFLDPEMIDTDIAVQSRGVREASARMEGTGGGFGAFVGGAVAGTLTPHGILSMFNPATRAPVWLSEQAVGGWLRNVGREALFQALTQGGAQAVGSALDYGSRSQFGTQQTSEELMGEILGATAVGGVLGGAARGAVPAWLTVRRLWGAGAYVPTAVKDAAITLEGKAIYGDKNPLGLTASSNESALDKGVIDVAQNRPADLSGIIQPTTAAAAAPTPTAAGAQALPPVPDGMVRMFHGGDNATAGGSRDVAATFDYARNFGEGNKPVWYVDVPANSPWLKEVDTTGTNMPRQIMNSVAPEDVMAGAKLVPGTEPGAAAAQAVPTMPAGAAATEAVPPVPAAEAEKAVADARLQGAAAEPTVAPVARAADEAVTVEAARTREVVGNEITAREDELKAKHGSDYVGYRLEAKDDARLAALNAEYNALPEIGAAPVSPELQRLQKVFDEIAETKPAPKPAAQTPPTATERPVAPAPEPRPVDKAPGESPEDKATLDQAKRMMESPDAEIVVPAEKRAAYLAAEKQEQEARVAVGCLGGGAV